jgi:hypothetical protein
MRHSRVPSGRTVAILGAFGASLALGAPALAADPAPPIPQPVTASANPAAAAPPPAHKVPAAVKQTSPPAHPHTQPLIPPAALPGQTTPLSAPPTPREPLPLQVHLLPLGAPPAVSTPPKPPAG